MKVEEQNEMKNQKPRARNETSSTQQEIEYRDDNAHREINFV